MRLASTLAFGLVLLAVPFVRAQEVDPRWRYHAEIAAGVGLVDTTTTSSGSVSTASGGGTWLLRAGFFAPIAENRQAGGGVMVDGAGRSTLFGDYRLQQDFADPRVTTRLMLGAVMDMWPKFGLGARAGAGVGFELVPGLRGGVDLGVTVTAIHFRLGLDLLVALAYMF